MRRSRRMQTPAHIASYHPASYTLDLPALTNAEEPEMTKMPDTTESAKLSETSTLQR